MILMETKKIITTDLSSELETFFDRPRPMILYIQSLKKKNLTGVEIGTFKGKNAKHIINLLNIKTLYCVDPWIDNEYKPNGDRIYNEAKQLLKEYDNIDIIRKHSFDAANDIPNNLDFVYIDGNHSYNSVAQDINFYYPKLKPGGILGGHDYWASELGVVEAVNEFIIESKTTLYGDINDWWIVND